MASRLATPMRLRSPLLSGIARPQPLRIRSQLSKTTRSASTDAAATAAAADARSLVTRLRNVAFGTSITLFLGFAYLYGMDTRASVHQFIVVPSLRWIYPDAEEAHEVSTKLLKTLYSYGLSPRERGNADARGDLSVEVFGHKLRNPIGTSAGIDKLAEVPDALLAFGGAVVEVGGCTPFPQEGNPKPRVFRLPSQRALINRYGLNSKGAADMAMRLRERVRHFAYHAGLGLGDEAERMVLDGEAGVPPGSLTEGKIMCVQIAKNKNTDQNDIEAVKKDYVHCVNHLARYADVLVVNVSSPNTPGLRTLQKVEPLTNLLSGVVDAAQKADRKTKPRVMVKVSPDEDEDSQIEGIVEAIWRSGVDGVIVGNTTNRRTGLVVEGHVLDHKEQQLLKEQGGYSGPQMFARTLSLVKRYRKLLDQGPPPPKVTEQTSKPISGAAPGDDPTNTLSEKIESVKDSVVAKVESTAKQIRGTGEEKVIFATGGIADGKQALEILNAGASVAMVYTALVYGGVGTITRIKSEMREELAGKGRK